MPGPLAHIRVLDLSRVLAGPWAAQNLADLGAEVIKVERPGSGDDTRGWGPPWLHDAAGKDTQESAYYASVNRNKKSVTLDISKPDGQAIVRELAARCDVVIENYKVGTLARYGLAYDDLKAVNPRLVYCSVTGFGQDGPHAQRPGYTNQRIITRQGGKVDHTEQAGAPGVGKQRVGALHFGPILRHYRAHPQGLDLDRLERQVPGGDHILALDTGNPQLLAHFDHIGVGDGGKAAILTGPGVGGVDDGGIRAHVAVIFLGNLAEPVNEAGLVLHLEVAQSLDGANERVLQDVPRFQGLAQLLAQAQAHDLLDPAVVALEQLIERLEIAVLCPADENDGLVALRGVLAVWNARIWHCVPRRR